MSRAMRFVFLGCLGLAVTLGADVVRAMNDGAMEKGKKVCLCHVPPGNPANAHTICVGAAAVGAHMRHGDTMGECSGEEDGCGGPDAIPCDEGRFCKIADGECADDAVGECMDSPDVCPANLDPVCGCDGMTYNNACFADAAGIAVAFPGECEPAVSCGGEAGDTCDDGQYCARPAGECAEDAIGVCADLPTSCPQVLDPVCGCDDVTYDNDCLAAAAGVTVASAGACDDEGTACGGEAGDTCGMDEFCKTELGDCAEDAAGVCATSPTMCPAVIERVCGCDDKNYDNACMADAAGVNIASEGMCEPVAKACGGTAGDTCDKGQFCKIDDGVCDSQAEGVCTDAPVMCPASDQPVCGCDGMTYQNHCLADAAGVNVDSEGPCESAVEICDDEIDNDGDKQIDCNDTDCVEDPGCLPRNQPVRERRTVR